MNEPAAVHLGTRVVGPGAPALIVAELSGNHNGDLGRALAIIDAAAESGADAVKFQTYTPDSLTLDAPQPWFSVQGSNSWDGRRLYDLYTEAMTPWEWMAPLFDRARELGVLAFSTPFDQAAIDLLETFDPPAHKVASFELVDHELLAAVGRTGRPVIASTGLADEVEIDQAVTTLRGAGAAEIVLLHCNSRYPAAVDELDLRTIQDIRDRWQVPVGLSDHTMTDTSAVVAVALGACVLEKHVTLRRSDGGPDASFSLEPDDLARLVGVVREAESALGQVRYGPSPDEVPSLAFRRSLFFVADLPAGSVVERTHVRSVRPGDGLAPIHLPDVLGATLTAAVTRGTPVTWDVLDRDGALR
ncbi:MAG: pseudaminic acid synthase [Acidimicrobiia bacterium]|nr:pseudaminic acid synthase [Acidimicrobiia bacterium]